MARTRSLAASILRTSAVLVLVLLAPRHGAPCRADDSRRVLPPGDPGMADRPALLVGYFERFLKEQDLEAFRRDVDARYTEGSLGRATHSDDVRVRRAAVLALGLSGSFASNATVARRLKDKDPTVRAMAVGALWSIWCRADSPENNAELAAIQALIDRGRLDEATRRAGDLIAKAPGFAEAYNQRAIAHFLAGRLAESAADCRKVVALNPYHFGALGGLGQCQLRLGQRADAIRTYRQAVELQPYNDGLRETLAELEAAGD